MSNTLSDLAPKLLAQGLMALRNMNSMPQLVNNDYSAALSAHGLTVDVPIPSAIPVNDVAPGATPPSTGDITPNTVPVTLTEWKEAPFYLTDKDMQQAMSGVIPMQASEAVSTLMDTVNAYILGQAYIKFYGFTGTPGTTPFASDTTAATEARKILTNQRSPKPTRRVVFDPDAEANALNLRAFQDASFSADPNVIREGEITRKLGFDWFSDQQVPTHTAGTITTGLIAKASTAQAIGTKAITCTTAASTGACALVEGDIITFAGSTQTHVVTAAATQAAAATDVTVNIEPGLVVALAGSEAVTLKASHVANMAFHRNAIAFVTRPLMDVEGLGNIIRSAVDPVTGLAMRLEISREHKRTRFSYDLLYGCKVVRRELGMRIAG